MGTSGVFALIPARGGSKGIPQKNILSLAGFPLIAYSIVAAKLARRIDRVFVSTDCQEIAAVARRYGAEVPFLRPAALAQDDSPDRDFVRHALDWFSQEEGTVPQLIAHLRPTTPLRDPRLVDAAITALEQESQATSLRSGHEAPESPFKWFTRDRRGFFHRLALRSDQPVPDNPNLPRQAFPQVYVPNGYVDLLRSDYVRTHETIHGEAVLGYKTPVAFEIDCWEDAQLIAFLLKKGHPLLEHLQAAEAPRS